MVRTLIVDDERHCIDRLIYLLEKNHPASIEIVAAVQSVEEGLNVLKEHTVDLLLLDVQIHEQTAFDLLRKAGNFKYQVIFVTAYEHYAIEAFKYSALHFLLKPVDGEELNIAISKSIEAKHQEKYIRQIETLMENISRPANQSKRIVIATSTGLEILETTDIIRLESSINYTSIYIKNQTKLVVAKTLKEFEELLSDYSFCRVHHSHLVNLKYVKRYLKGTGGSVILENNIEVPVSSRKKEELLTALSKL
jgi:two-component system LytT family response regulator